MKQSRKMIYLAGFLFSIPIALASYINSSFISSFVGEEFVGVVYALGSLASVLALLLSSRIFRRLGGYKFLLLVAFLDALSFLALTSLKNTLGIIIVFIVGFSLNTLMFFTLDEMLKILSQNSVTGRVRGIYLTMCNLAWIVAQFSFATFLGEFSFRTIYLASFSVMILFLLIAFLNLKNIPDPQYDNLNIFKYVKKFFKNINLVRAYGLSFLLQFFYCWMIIYTPIYLYVHLGFTWKEIGFIFFIMLLPFLFIPFRTGRIADKVGERKILMFGFVIAALATFSLFFVREHSIWLWAVLLLGTRVGASSIDGTIDTYFFKHIKPENEELIGVYRSASPLAYILGPLAASLILLLVPSFNYIFLILGTLLLFGVYLASTIRKSDI